MQASLSSYFVGRSRDLERTISLVSFMEPRLVHVRSIRPLHCFFAAALIKDNVMSLINASPRIAFSDRPCDHLRMFVSCKICCRADDTVVDISFIMEDRSAP